MNSSIHATKRSIRFLLPSLLAVLVFGMSGSALVTAQTRQGQGRIPKGAVQLSHVGNATKSKRSIAGSGHVVVFDRPENVKSVVAVQIYGSRYGYPKPPNEDFHVYLLGKDRKILKDFPFPYKTVQRTSEMRWYTLNVPPTEVPERFHVAVSFNPQRTKGIYLGMDEKVKESHSFTGLPGREFRPLSSTADWMVRVYLAPGKGAAATPGGGKTASGGFGPVIEREFRADASASSSFVDLEAGKVVPVPAELQQSKDREAWTAWSRENGVDVRFRVQGDKCLFGQIEVCLVPYPAERWRTVTPAGLRSHRELLDGELRLGNITLSESDMPATHLFKTRQGGLGVLQVVGFTDNFQSVKVRYKLIQ